MASLDDFNRRMTAGSSSWMNGPPTNAAESAAQAYVDAQSRRAAAGGGSVDFGVRISAIILLVGISLFAVGAYISDHFRGAMAMTGLLVVLISGFLLLVGGGLFVGCIKDLGAASGRRGLLFAALAALGAVHIS